ncbi:MAG: class I tRNA ligase family protein [Candidatus Dojkabacteria bacterium]|nr:class I tRNA ligase family protein [Candidatus Dojkabacteria bacterium]
MKTEKRTHKDISSFNETVKHFEKKWNQYWKEKEIYKTLTDVSLPKFYSLYSFPYPSGSGLHVGHAEGMVANDIFARYYRMKGYRVLFPMGWDAFGLPAENYAIKTGIPPSITTKNAIDNFKKQIDLLGISVDWDKEIGTHEPSYYKWTQWLFLELFKRKKAYKKLAPVNWCPSCKTVLANEQVIENKCERCETEVIQKEMSQWFFKITDYAEKLYMDIEDLDWPKGTKEHQKHWIGRSEGTQVVFKLLHEIPLKVYVSNTSNNLSLLKIQDILKKSNLNITLEQLPDSFSVDIEKLSSSTAYSFIDKTTLIKQPILFENTEIIFPTLSKKNYFEIVDEITKEYVNDNGRSQINQKINEYFKDLAKTNGGYLEVNFINHLIVLMPSGEIKKSTTISEYYISSIENTNIIDSYLPIKNLIVSKLTLKPITENYENWYPEERSLLQNIYNTLYEYLDEMTIFTTRIDTIFGCTFCVIAPEHNLIEKIKEYISNKQELEEYLNQTKHKSILARQIQKEKTGVILKDIKAINPLTLETIPVYVADYVIGYYGTGSIMSVPAHDIRDYEFAKKFNIPIKYVVIPENDNHNQINEGTIYTNFGKLINSSELSGYSSQEAINIIQTFLESKKLGTKSVTYKLKDWLISRQRYWGAPIPIIYSQKAAENGYGYVPKESLNILFLHGLGSKGEEGWRVHFKNEMEKLGHNIFMPNLPNANNPNFNEWFDFVLNNFSSLFSEKNNKKLVIIGHSLGGLLSAKIAEKFTFKKLVLIAPAPPIREIINKTDNHSTLSQDITKFFDDAKDIDEKKIMQNIDEIVLINSTNDTVIPIEFQKYYKSRFESSKCLIKDFNNFGHFSTNKDGLLQFEELYPLINIRNNTDLPGIFPVFEKHLPVELPTDVNFLPTGESPIKYSKTFNIGVTCPIYGTEAFRETDTMDTFVDSSWYFLRYSDAKNSEMPFAREKVNMWLPADIYMIGSEHTVLHLLYSRFIVKFLHEYGYINFNEPFPRIMHMGLILGQDGRKMSKRWNNVINPIDEIEKYSADTLRMYEMFMGPYEDTKPWNDRTEKGVFRFLYKIWECRNKVDTEITNVKQNYLEQEIKVNELIKQIEENIEKCNFNVAIAKLMETTNYFNTQIYISLKVWKIFLKLLAPFAPYISEELWHLTGETESIHTSTWPKYNLQLKRENVRIQLAVQIDGKFKGTVEVNIDDDKNLVIDKIQSNPKIGKYLKEKKIKKIVFIKNKIINILLE